MSKKYYLILCLLCFLVFSGQSQQYNGTYKFLDATASARVAALGGSLIPINDSDIQLGLYNPSLINDSMDNALALSYVDYFTDINIASIQYAKSFKKIGNFMATMQYHNYGKFNYATENGYQDGTAFTAADYALTIGWGRQLNPHFSIGANIKFAGIQYENFSAFALAADVSGSYKSDNGWMFSLAARNIGYELYTNFEGENDKLPFKMQVGMAKKLEHLPLTFIVVYDNLQKWDLSYDDPLDLDGNYDPITGEKKEKGSFNKFAKNLFCHFVIGGELYIGKNLVIRASYNYGQRQDLKIPTKKGMVGFSYGAGIRIYKFNINYSRSEMHIYGSPNYISITTNLDRFVKKNKHKE